MQDIKKFPVTYKGKQYEVRFEDGVINRFIKIYSVDKIKNLFGRYKTKYKEEYSNWYNENDKDYGFGVLYKVTDNSDPEFYIKAIKLCFESYERHIEYKKKKNRIRE